MMLAWWPVVDTNARRDSRRTRRHSLTMAVGDVCRMRATAMEPLASVISTTVTGRRMDRHVQEITELYRTACTDARIRSCIDESRLITLPNV